MIIKKINQFLKLNKIKFNFYKTALINYGAYNYNSKKVFVFAPEAALHPHFHACCYLGRLLKEDGFNVSMARCWNMFEKCIVKQSNRVNCQTPNEKIFEICYACAKNSVDAQKKYNLKFLNLNNYNTEKTKGIIENEFNNIEEMLKKKTLSKYFFQKIPFGTLCEYEIQLTNKSLCVNYNNKNLTFDWVTLLKSVIKTHVVLKNLFFVENIKNLVYFNDYAVNLAARFAMDANQGQSTMVTHAYNCGIDRRKIVFFKEVSFKKMFNDCIEWEAWKSKPLLKKNVIQITEDAIARFCGQSAHTYSPPFEPLHKNNFTNNKKTIVVFTSSPDESACFKVISALNIQIPPQEFTFGKSFQDCQKKWLLALQRYAKKNQDINFIVRIHPREGSNKRELGDSEHLKILKTCLKHPPPNFSIFWPENKVSSYTLGLCADLVLTSWSTIGIEMARLGIPVLTCTKGTAGFPIEKFIVFEKNQKAYLKSIKIYLRKKYSLARIRDAFRWWFFSYLSSSIDISDVVPTSEFSDLSEFKKTKQNKIIRRAIFSKFDIRKYNYKNKKETLAEGKMNERKALYQSIERLLLFFCTGNDQNKTSKILFCKNKMQFKKITKNQKWNVNQKNIVLHESSKTIAVFFEKKILKFKSPCLTNLARLVLHNKKI